MVRKVARGEHGETWRDTIKPVRLFQKEIQELATRSERKRRRLDSEEIEDVDTEEEEEIAI